MDAELKRRVDALRRPLQLAAQNGFAGVRRVQGLGNVLRIACDGLMQRWQSEPLAAWRVTLARWEQLPVDQQEAEVARGMRLIARLPSAPSAAGAKLEKLVDKPIAEKSVVAKPVVEPPATEKPVEKKPGEKKPKAEKPTEPVDPLSAPTHSLPGIGPAFAERLAEKNLETVEDLLWCLPRRYDDVRDAKPLAEVVEMEEGMRATFAAKVASARMVFVRGRRWAEVRLGAVDLTQPASAVVRWFNVWAGIEKRMPAGSVVKSMFVKN